MSQSVSPPTSTSSPSAPPPSEPRSLAESWRLALSSWVMSGVLHFVLMLVLVLNKACQSDDTDDVLLDSVPQATAPDA